MHKENYLKPGLILILEKLKLDKNFHKSKSNYLYYLNDDGKEVKVVDFVGGFGSLILGHNHPEMVEYAHKILNKNIPIHSQISKKYFSSQLSKNISDIIEQTTGDKYICTLTNSGAETVEAAFKHARLQKLKEINKILENINLKLNRIDNRILKRTISNFNSEEIKNIVDLKNYILNSNKRTLSLIKPRILSGKKGYHGKTLGALKATHNPKYKDDFLFENEKEDVLFFDWEVSHVSKLINDCSFTLLTPKINSDNSISIEYIKLNSCLAVIIEPILGEGGVVKVPRPFLQSLREITARKNIPFIIDEIQTGMYRTGHFLYSLKLSIKADYFLLGKSLGGGMVKIGSLMINKNQYNNEFCSLHTSTFAEDEYSSAIAIKALELSKEKSDKIKEKGKYLYTRLRQLKENHDSVIDSISGEGLMIGLKFKSYDESDCYALQYISRSGYFNYFISSYLLNNFNIRVAPTLSDSFTIRIQPSALIKIKDIDSLINSLENLIKVLFNKDVYYLIQHLLGEEYQNLRPLKKFNHAVVNIQKSENLKVGFLCHFIDYENFIVGNSSLQVLPKEVTENFLLDMIELNSCIIPGSKVIKSNQGMETEFVVIGLPFTSKMVKEAFQTGNINIYREICNKAIQYMRKNMGITIIGLGQYTSILLSNGKNIPQIDLSITTGNSYTTYIGLKAVLSSFPEERLRERDIVVGIIGAAGNISSVYSKCFSENASKIYLKGSDSQKGFESVKKAANQLLQYVFDRLLHKPVKEKSLLEKQLISTQLFSNIKMNIVKLTDASLYTKLIDELQDNSPIIVYDSKNFFKKCELIILATNSPKVLFTSDDFNCDTFIYDISVPANIIKTDSMAKKRIKIISGGVVKIPNNQSLYFNNFPFPLEDGSAFACMAETMILGLEKHKGNFSYGDIIPEMVYEVGEMGEKHGFKFFKDKEIKIF